MSSHARKDKRQANVIAFRAKSLRSTTEKTKSELREFVRSYIEKKPWSNKIQWWSFGQIQASERDYLKTANDDDDNDDDVPGWTVVGLIRLKPKTSHFFASADFDRKGYRSEIVLLKQKTPSNKKKFTTKTWMQHICTDVNHVSSSDDVKAKQKPTLKKRKREQGDDDDHSSAKSRRTRDDNNHDDETKEENDDNETKEDSDETNEKNAEEDDNDEDDETKEEKVIIDNDEEEPVEVEEDEGEEKKVVTSYIDDDDGLDDVLASLPEESISSSQHVSLPRAKTSSKGSKKTTKTTKTTKRKLPSLKRVWAKGGDVIAKSIKKDINQYAVWKYPCFPVPSFCAVLAHSAQKGGEYKTIASQSGLYTEVFTLDELIVCEPCFRECYEHSLLRFDYYFPEYHALLELDGYRHFDRSAIDFKMIFARDQIKNTFAPDLCKFNYLRISNTHYTEMKQLIQKWFTDIKTNATSGPIVRFVGEQYTTSEYTSLVEQYNSDPTPFIEDGKTPIPKPFTTRMILSVPSCFSSNDRPSKITCKTRRKKRRESMYGLTGLVCNAIDKYAKKDHYIILYCANGVKCNTSNAFAWSVLIPSCGVVIGFNTQSSDRERNRINLDEFSQSNRYHLLRIHTSFLKLFKGLVNDFELKQARMLTIITTFMNQVLSSSNPIIVQLNHFK